MDKNRTIIAIAVSFVILIGWNQLAVHLGWISEPEKIQAPSTTSAPNTPESRGNADAPAVTLPTSPLPAFKPAPGRDVVIDTPLYRAVFYSGGGILREFSTKKYRESIDQNSPPVQLITPAAASKAPMGVIINGSPSWSSMSWSFTGDDLSLQKGQSGVLQFAGEANGLRLTRELTFYADRYAVTEKVFAQSETLSSARIAFTMSTGQLTKAASEYDNMRVAYLKDGSFTSEDSEKTLTTGISDTGVYDWAAVMNNYFLAAVCPADQSVTFKTKLEDNVYRVFVEKGDITLSPGQAATLDATYYLGPKEKDILDKEPHNLSAAINYGMFSIIAHPLLLVMNFFYQYVHNYGIAIILLTLVIKIILWPLSYKSYKSMEQMKKIQPVMAKLKEKYGKDREAMNREMMQLYKTYKINPASGCLPILVQIPVFIGLYQGLLGSILLRHASFITYLPFTDWLWLADLSVRDPYYITPLVMGGTMFFQQWITPSAGDPMQQKIMLIMPVVFTFMFLNFPSGLVVYWLTNNVISIAQQWWQLHRKS
ncbi:membrane protein insertase YidC [Deltaproteobacteria bacterium]|nr:membrane protein insertase YidC [Deltaproteobacteria bacterium]